MPARSPAVRRASARAAALSRDRAPSDPEYLTARRELGAAVLVQQIQDTTAKYGPLTPEQAEQIAGELLSAVGGGAA